MSRLKTIPVESSIEHLLAALAYIDLRIRWAVVRARVNGLNPDDEFRGLYISEDEVDKLIGYELGGTLWPTPNGSMPDLAQWPQTIQAAREAWTAATLAARQAGVPMALDALVQQFELSEQETDVLLLTLAPEIDPRYERLYAYLQDDVTKKQPSVNLVLDFLTDTFTEKLAQRHLVADSGRLIHHRLVERVWDNNGKEPTLLAQSLRPAAALVEHLLGQQSLDRQLVGCANLVSTQQFQPSPRVSPDYLNIILRSAADTPIYRFIGGYGVGKGETALAVAHALNRPLLHVNLAALGQSDIGLKEGLALIQRDGTLAGAILYLTEWESVLKENSPPAFLFDFLLNYPQVAIVGSEALWQPARRQRERPILPVVFESPDFDGRYRIWSHYFADGEGLDITAVANHFRFTPGQIEDVVATARDLAHWDGSSVTQEHLLAASRAHSNQKLSTLATKIKPRFRWRDIILPGDTLSQLEEMVNTVQRRPIVYEEWGFGRKLAMGKGTNALFAGEPGTGKTMSADIIAGELGLDLYKIDLSTVVDKYIGETEKNIGRIFDEATTSNAILFFDEADSLFGKRSEVKDSHDRHANIQTGYLLQRMEEFDGVVILATNLRANIDEAFTRRLHFAIEFPFPESEDRERIWRVTFPKETPRAANIDYKLLADRFRLAGGNIRNIVLAAAFLAASDNQPVGMPHLLHAARREYQKMGRLINESLFIWPPAAADVFN